MKMLIKVIRVFLEEGAAKAEDEAKNALKQDAENAEPKEHVETHWR